MPKVIIMRGLPGSGKSTWTTQYYSSGRTVSADHYHMKEGRYEFKQENIGLAHIQCLKQYLEVLNQKTPLIVVDNTNLAAWEIAPYYRLAEVFGYEVEIVWLRCYVEKCVARNIHNVPRERIGWMADILENEKLPMWWKQTVIIEENK